jgi:hypothetical protein
MDLRLRRCSRATSVGSPDANIRRQSGLLGMARVDEPLNLIAVFFDAEGGPSHKYAGRLVWLVLRIVAR